MYAKQLLLVLIFASLSDGQTGFDAVEFRIWNKLAVPGRAAQPYVGLLDSKDPAKYMVVRLFKFTHCLYAYLESTSDNHLHTLVSIYYNRPSRFHEVNFYLNANKKASVLILHETSHAFENIFPKMNKWVHICYSWVDTTGLFTLYFDGVEKATKTIKEDGWMSAECYLILGQDQTDNFQGYLMDGMRGRITQFNIWDRALTLKEVNCAKQARLHGNIVDWRNATLLPYDYVTIAPSQAPYHVSDGKYKWEDE